MKKLLFTATIFFTAVAVKAQYGSINAVLDRLEQNKGINQHLENVSLDDKKFVLVKDFEDHTERQFIVLKGKAATYVEIFDDKKTGESSTNVFSGDFVRTENNVVSLRCDRLDGQRIQIPVAKTLLLTRQKDILYLVDVNNKDRWIEEKSIISAKKKK